MLETCPDDLLQDAAETARTDAAHAIDQIDRLLQRYAEDARLMFLRGSLLASLERYQDARDDMSRALKTDPAYDIARFQLGLLELSSGDTGEALQTWKPLERLPPDHALRLFARGLTHLARDQFGAAMDLLTEGIGRNTQYPPVNADMRLMVDEIRKKLAGADQAVAQEESSSTQMLLRQFSRKPTKH